MEEKSDNNTQSAPLADKDAPQPASEVDTSKVNEKGEIIRSEIPQQETSEEEQQMRREIQELADESEGGLDPNNFTGKMKDLVQQVKDESEAANKARAKLKAKHYTSEDQSPLPLDKIRKE